MFCRNKIRPWCLVQWQLLKKWCQWNNRTYGHLRTQVILHAVYAIFHKFCGHSDRVFRVYYSLEIVFPHFNDFWSTIYLTTYVGSDGDLFLFLTFCQKSDWFYQPTVQLLGRWPYIFKHFCGIAWVSCGLPTARKLPWQFDVLIWPPNSSQ